MILHPNLAGTWWVQLTDRRDGRLGRADAAVVREYGLKLSAGQSDDLKRQIGCDSVQHNGMLHFCLLKSASVKTLSMCL